MASLISRLFFVVVVVVVVVLFCLFSVDCFTSFYCLSRIFRL